MGTEWKKRGQSSSGTTDDWMVETRPDPDIEVTGIRYPRTVELSSDKPWGYIDPDMLSKDYLPGVEALQRLNLRELQNKPADLEILKRMGDLATSLIDVDDRAWELREDLRARYAELRGREYEREPMPQRYPEKGEEQQYDVASELRKAMGKM